MRVEISRAAESEAGRLTEIAHAAKRHWQYPERWMELWKDALTIRPEFIAGHEVYSARVGGRAVGFYALLPGGEKASLEHLWIDPAYIGSGLGRRLFDHAVNRAAGLGAKWIEIESDPNAEGFYKHMGARRVGEAASDLDGQPRVLPLLIFDVANRQDV